jgi:hypothetical protein
MKLVVLDSNFIATHVIDTVSSFIWTDRYCGFGDFEVTADIMAPSSEGLVNGYYLRLGESEHLMIQESYNLHAQNDGVDIIIVKGRSLETILERRIIWYPTTLSGNFQDAIIQLLTENAIWPEDEERIIPELGVTRSIDPLITSLEIDSQFFGETLYKVITELCISRNIGYKVELTSENFFNFSLYAGTDRSQSQFANPYVIFSPKFNNLVSSDYVSTDKFLKTVSLVAGEKGVGNGRTTVVVQSSEGAGTGINRREIFTDASGVTRTTPDGKLSDEEYLQQLAAKGVEDLALNTLVTTVDGQIDPTRLYVFGRDFFMGDIVQLETNHGHKGRSRITELTFSQDESGTKIFPTFVNVSS